MQMLTRAYQRRTREVLLNMQRKKAKKKGSVLEKNRNSVFCHPKPFTGHNFQIFHNFDCSCSYVRPAKPLWSSAPV